VTPDFHALLDGDRYLPASWIEDRARRSDAGIPAAVVFEPKWQLDTTLPRSVMARRLEQTAAKIEYWQRRAEEAARAHCKRRCKELRRAGIDLRRAISCPKWV